ncbi:hypothetical protein J6590_089470 [Homalodisca vitripennis]|nr:hypothetical protein J6590_089470 [Homalodisca vitripennis]
MGGISVVLNGVDVSSQETRRCGVQLHMNFTLLSAFMLNIPVARYNSTEVVNQSTARSVNYNKQAADCDERRD